MRSSFVPNVVVVTGVNGGLGQALASVFLEHGAHVAGIGRQSASSFETTSAKFSYWQADVTNCVQVREVFDGIVSQLSRIDVVFNAAAIYPKVSFLEQDVSEWATTIQTNVSGMAFCCRAALDVMLKQQFGRIYNVGSFADLAPIPKSSAYAASKGAVRALVKGIAADLQSVSADIQVHEWIPGHLKTKMSDYTGLDPVISARWALDIVLANSASGNGVIFEHDREWNPPEGLRQRLKRLLGFTH